MAGVCSATETPSAFPSTTRKAVTYCSLMYDENGYEREDQRTMSNVKWTLESGGAELADAHHEPSRRDLPGGREPGSFVLPKPRATADDMAPEKWKSQWDCYQRKIYLIQGASTSRFRGVTTSCTNITKAASSPFHRPCDAASTAPRHGGVPVSPPNVTTGGTFQVTVTRCRVWRPSEEGPRSSRRGIDPVT